MALLGGRGTSEIRTFDPRKMAPICCSMRVAYSIIAAWVKLQLDPIFFLWSMAV